MTTTLRENLLDRARHAAVDVAQGLGLTVDAAELIVFASNVILKLEPHNLVARVTGETALIRPVTEGRMREVSVAEFLAEAGAPVVPPSKLIDPGPHDHDGLTITFWDYVSDTDKMKLWSDARDTLHACREALVSCPEPLPYMQGYNEARALFHELWQRGDLGTIDPGDVVRRLAEIDAVLADRGGASNVPLHGDAHLKNMLVADHPDDRRRLWIDWDDVCTGPVEWDHACLIVSIRDDESRVGDDAALMAAVADGVDRDCLEAMIDARNLQRELWGAAIKALNKSDVAAAGFLRRGARFLRRQILS